MEDDNIDVSEDREKRSSEEKEDGEIEDNYFYLSINSAAGDYIITRGGASREFGFSLVGKFKTREAAEEEVKRIRSISEVYAVFIDTAAGEGFVSREDDLSGNWRGSKYGYYTLIEECSTRKEAEKVLERELARLH